MSAQKPAFLPSFTKTWHATSYPSISPSRSELSVKGKNIIITGGGTGIGASIALSYAKAGASAIGLVARREDKLQTSKLDIEKLGLGTKVEFALADITDATALTKAFTDLSSSFGKIDVLVANAGYVHRAQSVSDIDGEDWWHAVDVNLRGPFNSIRSFIPIAAEKALFVNITSGAGHVSPSVIPGHSGYAASKAASAKLIEHAASELKDKGVRLVNVQPGVVETDMQQKSSSIAALDTPDLPGDFCLWLASKEADFLNGRFVYVNWDVDELKGRKEEIEKDPLLLTISLEGPTY